MEKFPSSSESENLSEEEAPEENWREKKQIKDVEAARHAANAEKPLRDLARREDAQITEKDKRAIDKIAEQRGRQAIERLKIEDQEAARQLKLGEIVERGPYYDEPTTKLELNPRARRALSFAQIRTIGLLSEKTRKELLEIPNSGDGTVNLIENELQKLGLRLGMRYKNI